MRSSLESILTRRIGVVKPFFSTGPTILSLIVALKTLNFTFISSTIHKFYHLNRLFLSHRQW